MNYRTQLERLKQGLILEQDLTQTIDRIVDGFENVLRAGEACRESQKNFFKARKAGQTYDATKYLDESKKNEKIFDDLLRFWKAEMLKQPHNPTLFD